MEIRERRKEYYLFRKSALHFANEQLSPRGFS
jgi:hypothetical protein